MPTLLDSACLCNIYHYVVQSKLTTLKELVVRLDKFVKVGNGEEVDDRYAIHRMRI